MAHGRRNGEIFAGTPVSEELALFFGPAGGRSLRARAPLWQGREPERTLVLFSIMISAPRRCLGILVVPLLVMCVLALCVVCGLFDGCGAGCRVVP